MIGNLQNDSNVLMIDLKSTKETYLATLPVPKIYWYIGDVDEYRIGCTVMFGKNGAKELVTVSKPYDRYHESYCHTLNLSTLSWNEFNCGIKFSGKASVQSLI